VSAAISLTFIDVIAGIRSRQDKGSLPSNDYPVAGHEALVVAMDDIPVDHTSIMATGWC
jgi:hypothetical protein